MKTEISTLVAVGLAVAISLGAEVGVKHREVAGIALSLPVIEAGEASAQAARRTVRRTARRTARRTTARHNYIRALPGGCVLRGAYHYCGGVYYQPVQQNGATVYIVVTP